MNTTHEPNIISRVQSGDMPVSLQPTPMINKTKILEDDGVFSEKGESMLEMMNLIVKTEDEAKGKKIMKQQFNISKIPKLVLGTNDGFK